MISGAGIKNPRCRRMCKASRDITSLGNRSNGGRFGCLSETKVLLIFTGRRNDPRGVDELPETELELVE